MTSLIYRNAFIYGMLMRALYGRHYRDRDRLVAEQTPAGCSVVDLCCGPGTLYLNHLKAKGHKYLGVDINQGFLDHLSARGARTQHADLLTMSAVPEGDVVLMQASLYHFLPDGAERILDAMFAAARRRVIISEPIRNISQSRLGALAKLAHVFTDPGTGKQQERFDEISLDRMLARYHDRLETEFLIPGGREKVYVFDASRRD